MQAVRVELGEPEALLFSGVGFPQDPLPAGCPAYFGADSGFAQAPMPTCVPAW